MKNINERFQYVIEFKKLKQKALAKKMGVSEAHISQIKKGTGEPSEMFINYFCLLYGIDENWMKTGEGNSPTKTIELLPGGKIGETIHTYGNAKTPAMVRDEHQSIIPYFKNPMLALEINKDLQVVENLNEHKLEVIHGYIKGVIEGLRQSRPNNENHG